MTESWLSADDIATLLDVSDLSVRRITDSPESVAKREKSLDFDQFEYLFKAKHSELAEGVVTLAQFKGLPTVQEGTFLRPERDHAVRRGGW